MKVALVANSSWLDEELASLRYLAVGFLDEQISVIQIVPHDLPDEDAIQFGITMPWQESDWAWVRRQRLLALEPALKEEDVTILHSLHRELWDGSLRLAANLDVPVVLTISSGGDVEHLNKFGKLLGEARVALAATTQPIAEALEASFDDRFAIATLRSGVHLSELDEDRRPDDRPVCVVISGSIEVGEDFRALFQAIANVIRNHPETQFFLDASEKDTHPIWRLARDMNLLKNISMTPHRLGHREIEMSADAIIHPQATGMSRSMTLQAMAHAVPVLAKEDPWIDYLIDGETAWLVREANVTNWEVLLRRVIEDPDAAMAIGMKARMWVGRDHLASQQVADVLKLYKQVTGEEMKFPG